jgi:tetratricopeptide (TPR) repeat protein
MFMVTRAVASSNREMAFRDAAEWYGRGEQAFAAGHLEEAIDDLRRASARDRGNAVYIRSLARALSEHHDDEAARNLLLTLRESSPDDVQLNIDLARLAARRHDTTEASRFYHNALYAPWPVDGTDERRRIRLELIQFLLDHNQRGRAEAELLAAASDLPYTAQLHLQIAQLFAKAGDDIRALEHFQQALEAAPSDGALAGAGLSAFRLGQYSKAAGYLRRVNDAAGELIEARDVVEHVLADDPLAPRIGSVERRQRLTSDLSYVGERLTACGAAPLGGWTTNNDTLQRESEAFLQQLRQSPLLEQDTIESGLELLNRAEQQLAKSCGPATARDRALLLIVRGRSPESK